MFKELELRMLFFIIILFQSNLVSLGQCDEKLKPAGDPSVTYKVRGNRCEGTYAAKVGAESMEVVSFTIGPFSYKLEETEVIEIKNSLESSVFIRSLPLPLNTYYRMDASLENDETLKWEVREVLFDLKIRSKHLGVYGWLAPEWEKTYLPVKPITSNYNASDKKLYLIIRTRARVKEAKFRYALSGQNLGDYETISGANATRQNIIVVLPENLKDVYIIEIGALLEGSDQWEARQYKLLMK